MPRYLYRYTHGVVGAAPDVSRYHRTPAAAIDDAQESARGSDEHYAADAISADHLERRGWTEARQGGNGRLEHYTVERVPADGLDVEVEPEKERACAVCGRRLSFGCIHTADGSAYGQRSAADTVRAIVDVMDGAEWSAATTEAIAGILHAAGYRLAAPEDL